MPLTNDSHSLSQIILSSHLAHRQPIYLGQVFFHFVLSHSRQDAEGGRGRRGGRCVVCGEEDHGHGWHPLEVTEVWSEEFDGGEHWSVVVGGGVGRLVMM